MLAESSRSDKSERGVNETHNKRVHVLYAGRADGEVWSTKQSGVNRRERFDAVGASAGLELGGLPNLLTLGAAIQKLKLANAGACPW
jgi:hypothetical protein